MTTDYVSYGWVCPKCGRVYSPSVVTCLYCGGDNIITFTNADRATASPAYSTTDTTVSCDTCGVPHNDWTGCPKQGGKILHDAYYCAGWEPKHDRT